MLILRKILTAVIYKIAVLYKEEKRKVFTCRRVRWGGLEPDEWDLPWQIAWPRMAFLLEFGIAPNPKQLNFAREVVSLQKESLNLLHATLFL